MDIRKWAKNRKSEIHILIYLCRKKNMRTEYINEAVKEARDRAQTLENISNQNKAGCNRIALWLIGINMYLAKDIFTENNHLFLSNLFICLLPLSIWIGYYLYKAIINPYKTYIHGFAPNTMKEIYNIDNDKFYDNLLQQYQHNIEAYEQYYKYVMKNYKMAKRLFVLFVGILIVASVCWWFYR
ncbi:MAG: hypothetical protein ACRCR9_02775 [Chitinophagaceae bacterium]